MRWQAWRRQALLAGAAVVVSVSVAGAAGAAAIGVGVLDFEDRVHGEVISDQYADQGIHIEVENSGRGPDLGVAFDSRERNTDDEDLEAAEGSLPWSGGNIEDEQLGLFLIIQENGKGCDDGICNEPDDEGFKPAGQITFSFDFPLLSFGFDLVDVESDVTENGKVTFFDGATQIGRLYFSDFSGVEWGDHSANRIDPIGADLFGAEDFDRVVVKLGGSGAIDNVLFSSMSIIPEPASGLLVALGLSALAIARRR